MSLTNFNYTRISKPPFVGNATRYIEAQETPLCQLAEAINPDFLSENVSFDETVGTKFYSGDLVKIWSNPILLRALLSHPTALPDIKKYTKYHGMQIDQVKVSEALHCLGITQDALWENNIETVEDLVSNFHKIDNELARQDLNSAFLSMYGINLMETVAEAS